MKLLADPAAVDRQAIEGLGIPGLLLMEEASRLVSRAVLDLLDTSTGEGVVLVCGRGNNGGDGYACARRLAMAGCAPIRVIRATDPLQGDAALQYGLLKHYAVDIVEASDADTVSEVLSGAAVVVDALFGSGLSREITGEAAQWIAAINAARFLNPGQTVVSVDLPSGIDALTGQVRGVAVRADATVTFVSGKPGLFLHPGKAHAGTVIVADIGIPPALVEADPSPFRLVTPEVAAQLLPERDSAGHKYTFGSVLVIAGSRTMPGAAVLCAEAALMAGAGIVTLAAPQSLFHTAKLSPELLPLPLPETPEGALGADALPVLREALTSKRINAVALGPGLGLLPATQDLIQAMIGDLAGSNTVQSVVDADALNALACLPELPKLGPDFVLTPHLGEAARLRHQDKGLLEADLPGAAQALQQHTGAQVVLKSATTVVADSDGRCWINDSGNDGMATAGSGDVLTGLIAGLLAQGASPAAAAVAAVHLHGMAGDLAADALTAYATTAGDILAAVPEAFGVLLDPPGDEG